MSIPPELSDNGGAQVVTVSEFTARARDARKQREYDLRLDRYKFAQIGRDIGRVLDCAAVHSGTVRRWFVDVIPPDLNIICALAIVLDVDPGWLAFGKASTAQAPAWFTPRPPTEDGPPDAPPGDGQARRVAQGRRQLPAARAPKPKRPDHRRSG